MTGRGRRRGAPPATAATTAAGSRRARGAVAALGAAALLAACGGAPEPEGGPSTQLPSPGPVAETADDPALDPALADVYGQEPAWVPCGEVLECATVAVPVDWDAPDGELLDLAVSRVPAGDEDDRLGSVLVNPGGPGASGVDLVGADGSAAVSEAVRERYDVVGFDPRGVGSSDPVDCLDDAALDEYLATDVDTSTPEGEEEVAAREAAFARGCAEDAGPLLGEVGTVDAARDLDVLRAVLGDERLTYVGRSYGTLLGAEYLRQFPARAGRLVLDGALDPADGAAAVALAQAEGLERALTAFVTACGEGDVDGCPLEGTAEEGLSTVAGLVESTRDAPLPTGDPDRPLTRPLAATGVVAALYDDGTWPLLGAALTDALDGDGSGLLQLADAYAGRLPDGTYRGNTLEAFVAVSCLDRPGVTAEEAEELTEQLGEVAPTLGSLVGGGATCVDWPVPPTRTPAPVEAPDALPTLVVGTTGDPATPYVWSERLAEQLGSAALLTYDGEGHTAYLRGDDCVDGAVDAYLLDGVLPGDGATCGA